MTIYDVSLSLSPDMITWPGDPPVDLHPVTSMDAGAHANVSRLMCGVHAGTHVDAPHHFLNNHQTVESLPLDVLTGPAQVVQIPDEVGIISAQALEKAAIPAGTERLLLKTRNSQRWARGEKTFDLEFLAVSEDGAKWLVQQGIKLIGIDYLSIAPYKEGGPTHRALLEAGVVILEGLDLSAISPGEYALYCLPLKLVGSDGAPARTILVK